MFNICKKCFFIAIVDVEDIMENLEKQSLLQIYRDYKFVNFVVVAYVFARIL